MAIMKASPRVSGTNIQWNMAVTANCNRDQSTSARSKFSILLIGFGYLLNNMIAPFLVGIEVCVQEIGKEKQFEDGKHDEELHNNNYPEPPSNRAQVREAFVVKTKYPVKYVCLQKSFLRNLTKA